MHRQELHSNLKPFLPGQPAALEESHLPYLNFYGLDMREDFPALQQQLGSIESGHHTLCLHRFLQPAAKRSLLLVHGYLDHTGLYTHLIRYGLQRGYNVVMFDLPGHGLSSGELAVIDDFSDYSDGIANALRACSDLDTDWLIMAQSTGCAAFFDYCFKRGPAPFEQAVLLAPLVRPMGWWWINPAQRLLSPFTASVKRGFATNSSDADFLAFVRSDPLQPQRLSLRWLGALRCWLKTLPAKGDAPLPMLVFQGDQDGTVDWRYNLKRVQQMFAGVEVEMIADGGHHLANEDIGKRRQITALMDGFF